MLLLYKDNILKKIEQEYPKQDKNLEKIILFGSVAKGEYSPNSDIDVLLITNNKKDTIALFSEFKMNILLKYTVIINALYVYPEEFDKGIEPIYAIIKNEGCLIWE